MKYKELFGIEKFIQPQPQQCLQFLLQGLLGGQKSGLQGGRKS